MEFAIQGHVILTIFIGQIPNDERPKFED